jgi:stalled ribosome rescue protein Dom34
MQNPKKLAVYLDHSQAILFNFGISAIEFTKIESEINHQINKGESHLHNKEQHLQHKYYQKIGEAILDFDSVLLFGPTDAKTELFNYLCEINKFGKISIKVKTSDKLTENQQIEFINDYFSELK